MRSRTSYLNDFCWLAQRGDAIAQSARLLFETLRERRWRSS
ncbi:hypothetical protein [Komarekiella delphini-convector]|nr:hypothetical protein [Komarekiella delphini-convector]